MACSMYCCGWVKPLKRSQKARIRKEIEKRRKQAQTFHELQGNKWELSWEEIKEMFK